MNCILTQIATTSVIKGAAFTPPVSKTISVCQSIILSSDMCTPFQICMCRVIETVFELSMMKLLFY